MSTPRQKAKQKERGKPKQQARPLADFSSFGVGDEPTPKDESLAALEGKLEDSEDRRKSERFYSILGGVIVLDVFAASHLNSAVWAAGILIFQAVLLLGLAKQLGIDHVVVFMERIMAAIERRWFPPQS